MTVVVVGLVSPPRAASCQRKPSGCFCNNAPRDELADMVHEQAVFDATRFERRKWLLPMQVQCFDNGRLNVVAEKISVTHHPHCTK